MPRKRGPSKTPEELLADATRPFSPEAFKFREASTSGYGALHIRRALALLLCLRTEQGQIARPLGPSPLFLELGKLAEESQAIFARHPLNGQGFPEVPLAKSLDLLPNPPSWLQSADFLRLFAELMDAIQYAENPYYDLPQSISNTVYELVQGGDDLTMNQLRMKLAIWGSAATQDKHLDKHMEGSVGPNTIYRNALLELQRAAEAAELVHPYFQAQVLEKASNEFAARMKAYRGLLHHHYMGTAQGSKKYSASTHTERVRVLYLHYFEGLSWPEVTEIFFPGRPRSKGWVTKRADEGEEMLFKDWALGEDEKDTPPYFPSGFINRIFNLTRLERWKNSEWQEFELLLESHKGL